MMLSILSTLSNYVNYLFDAIIILFTLIYLVAGYKRGLFKTSMYFLFDVLALVGAYAIYKFALPLVINKIPMKGIGLIKNTGTAFLIASLYYLIIEVVAMLLTFLILRFGIFKPILVRIDDYQYSHASKKNFWGRVVSATLTGGLAFLLSSTAIVATKKMTGNTLFKNYDREMSETYVAQHAEKFVIRLVRKMINTDSIPNPHDLIVSLASNGNHNAQELPTYRESIQRLQIANQPELYLAYVKADTDAGLVNFSHDLVVWAALASSNNTATYLDRVVNPLLTKAIELGYDYEGDINRLANVKEYSSTYTAEAYAMISTILY